MKSPRTLILVAGLVAASLSISGCASNPETPEAGDVQLAGVIGNIFDPYWLSVQCAADGVAAENGATISWYNTKDWDASAIEQAYQAAQLDEPQGLITSVGDPGRETIVRTKFSSVGIPVVSVSGTQQQDDTVLVSSTAAVDDTALNELADLIAAEIGPGGKIAIVADSPAGQWQLDRYQPVLDAVKAAVPDVQILEPIYTKSDVNGTATAVSALLTANPDLKVIYGIDGPIGQGIAAAVEQAGLVDSVSVYAFDAVPAEVEALRRGTIKGLVAQGVGEQARLATQELIDYIKENGSGTDPIKTADPAEIPVPNILLTADNIDSDAAAGYLYRATCD